MTRTKIFIAAALLLPVIILLSCSPKVAPQAPPGDITASVPMPRGVSKQEVLDEMDRLILYEERTDLTDEEYATLREEMDQVLLQVLKAPEEVRNDEEVQEILGRLCEFSLQLALDAGTGAEGPLPDATPPPLEELLEVTTFLSPDELKEQYAAVRSALEAKEPDFPLTVNDAVLSYVNSYQGRLRSWFQLALNRGGPHFPALMEIFREEGVPTSLVFLSIVESACNPRAYSRARAAGMWQFIAPTARRYGLNVDFWEDERWDPVRSARASAQYLHTLHGLFGDWQLALAAYNCGEAKVQRGLRKYPGGDYWTLRDKRFLVRETRGYVPAVLAATLIATNPEAYGFTVPPAPEREITTEVTIEKPADLKVLAKCAGITFEDLRDLNPALRRTVTPPRTCSLRIPARSKDSFLAAFAQVPEEELITVTMYTVRRGDSLSQIARKHGVTVEAIKSANRIRSHWIHPGQNLVIPVGGTGYDASLYAEARSKPRHSGSTYKVRRGDTLGGISRRTGVPIRTLRELNGIQGDLIRQGQRLNLGRSGSSSASQSPRPGRAIRPSDGVHRVRWGDNLWDIARRYGISVEEICSLNGFSKYKTLHPGDTLAIPKNGSPRPAMASGNSRAKPSTKSGKGTHTVRSGDNLWDIAQRYGTTVDQICRANGISKRKRLHLGEKLVIPSGGTAPAPKKPAAVKPPQRENPAPSGARVHTIRSGDNLWDIAQRYGTTVEGICSANGISKRKRLQPGDKLIIPSTETARVSGSSTENSRKQESPAPAAGGKAYRIRQGDNLWLIARNHDTTVDSLCELNGISKRKVLRPGDTLRVP